MKIISTRFHSVMDYLVGALFVALPFMFGWAPPASTIFIAAGVAVLGLTMLTAFEGGLIRIIPMGMHLTIDFLGAAFFLATPFLFDGIPESAAYAFWIAGGVWLLAALMTESTPSATVLHMDHHDVDDHRRAA